MNQYPVCLRTYTLPSIGSGIRALRFATQIQPSLKFYITKCGGIPSLILNLPEQNTFQNLRL